MKRKAFCWLRLALSLAVFVVGPGSTGSLRIFAQQIDAIGTRHWLGFMAGSVVANTPVLAPMSRRIASSFHRRSMTTDDVTLNDAA